MSPCHQLLQHSASAHSLIRYSLPYVSQIRTAICNEAAQIRRYISVQFEDYAVIGMMYDAAVQAGYQIIDFD